MRRGFRVAGWISLAVAAGWIATVMAVLFPLVPDFPLWDQWHLIPMWQAWFNGEPVLPQLLAPYNGHLNVLPRAVFFVLGLASRWDLRLEVAVGYGLALLTTVLLVRLLAAGDRRRWILAAPVAAAVFHLAQFEVFLSGYHLGQHLCQAALAGLLVLLFRERLPLPAVLGAAVCAAAATFSWGAGVIAWPLGGLVLLCRRRRLDLAVGFWAVAAAAVLWQVARAGTPAAVIWSSVPQFTATLLGSELSPRPFPDAAAALLAGTVGVGLFAGLAALALVRRPLSPQLWRAGAVALTGLAAALVIALGRAGVGPGHAITSHYATATAPFAIGLLALMTDALLAWWDRRAELPRRAVALPAVLLTLVLTGWVVQSARVALTVVPEVTGWMHASQMAFGRLLLGELSDEEIALYLHPSPALVREGVALLREHGLATFAPCSPQGAAWGGIERVSGAVVEGWAVDGGGRVPVSEVRLERTGQLFAIAKIGMARPDLAWDSGRAAWVLAGWRVELPTAVPAGQLQVVVVSCGGVRSVLGEVDVRPGGG